LRTKILRYKKEISIDENIKNLTQSKFRTLVLWKISLKNETSCSCFKWAGEEAEGERDNGAM
jgi:G:T-mismatch repair DNA endonuclease (very short patch repair protein)